MDNPGRSFGHLWHLARRFFGSVRPGPPAEADERWARSMLAPGERAIWDRMNNPDRRHAVGVARAVVDAFPEPPERPVVAAALLHDSGKVVSGLRTPARVAATVLWAIANDETARSYSTGRGLKRRLGEYRLHPEIGGAMLAEAGADPLTSAWAAEHHLPESAWTVPVELGRVLKACDDD